MSDAVMIGIVVAVLGLVTGGLATRFPRAVRPWIVLGLAEYVFCAFAQIVYTQYIYGGGDSINYRVSGEWLASLMDRNFSVAAPEVTALLIQRPSMFDAFLYGGGVGNTGSMYGIAGWLTYFLRGSGYATCTLVAGLSFLGALGIYGAFQRAANNVPPRRLFVGTVLFPSVAFWTATLHKEAFCLMGIGLLMTAWSGIRTGRPVRVLLAGPLGMYIVLLFRAPALPPLILGMLVFFLFQRLQKTRGVEATIVGPFYVVVTFALLALSMVLVTRVAPAFGIERLGESIAHQQQVWSGQLAGSSVGVLQDDAEPLSLSQQVLRIPLALANALLRPQLFDVRNGTMLLSAIEMTAIAFFIVRTVRHHGARGLLQRIQTSPFLSMCGVITLVGCMFVGLVTLNFGSLSRYRTPFLPFYGALLAAVYPVAVRKAPAVVRPHPVALRRRTAQ